MRHVVILAAVLAVGVSPALAQPPLARGGAPLGTSGPATAQQGTDKAPFGCDVRAPNVCHFLILYPRGSRGVVLPAGMKTTIPDVKVGRDGYCVGINTKPSHKCARKTINGTYNN